MCDLCGVEIPDVVYSLRCFADDVSPDKFGRASMEVASQNMRQNMSTTERHLCRACKDKITDGVFIL